MADTEKQRIKPFDEHGDYGLWRIRVEAACDAKELYEVLNNEENPHEEEAQKAKFIADQKKASNIIVLALSDKPLRVIRSNIGNPNKMLQRLDERYDSKSTASRVAKMSELCSITQV